MAGKRARPSEFALIARHFAPLTSAAPLAFDLTDDAAVVRPAIGQDLVVTTDCMVEGVHYAAGTEPGLVARKLLRVNLSDLAAKGARPIGYLLAAAFAHDVRESWIAAFASGLAKDQARFAVPLLGGDTAATPGRPTFSITAFGEVPLGRMIRRNGARPGDRLYVSGTIGDAALGLLVQQGKLAGLDARHAQALRARLELPEPRVALGPRLLGLATACIDISDGLVQDVGHIASTSGVAVRIQAAQVPLSIAARQAIGRSADKFKLILSGGDDYELAFAAPDSAAAEVEAIAADLGLAINAIGAFSAGEGTLVTDVAGKVMSFKKRGYQHF